MNRLQTLALLTVAVAAPLCASAEPFGFYAGAAAGQARVNLDQPTSLENYHFDEHHLGWKVLFGVRPLSIIGAEVEYVDFGHPDVRSGNFQADAKTHGAALYALGYLPLPVPFLDVYGKVGYARLTSSGSTQTSGNSAVSFDRTDQRFAWGAGVQVKLPVLPLTVRGEFERFKVDGGTPNFLSVGLLFRF